MRSQTVEFETRSRKNEMPTSVFTHDCDCDALRTGWLARVLSHEDRKKNTSALASKYHCDGYHAWRCMGCPSDPGCEGDRAFGGRADI